jgi:hypothetical protein
MLSNASTQTPLHTRCPSPFFKRSRPCNSTCNSRLCSEPAFAFDLRRSRALPTRTHTKSAQVCAIHLDMLALLTRQWLLAFIYFQNERISIATSQVLARAGTPSLQHLERVTVAPCEPWPSIIAQLSWIHSAMVRSRFGYVDQFEILINCLFSIF